MFGLLPATWKTKERNKSLNFILKANQADSIALKDLWEDGWMDGWMDGSIELRLIPSLNPNLDTDSKEIDRIPPK